MNSSQRLAALSGERDFLRCAVRTVITVGADTVDVDNGDGEPLTVACGGAYTPRQVGDTVLILISERAGWLAVTTTKTAGLTPA